ncbi:MAG: DUF4390 domain-containing protein [Desulfovibrionales bacterium]
MTSLKTMPVRRMGTAAIISVVLWCCSAVGWAQTMALNEMVLHNRAGEVNLRFGVDILEEQGLEEVLHNGGIVELRCRASLLRKRGLIWDKELAEYEFVSQIDANALTQDYIVRTEGSDKVYQGKGLPKILQEAWGMIDIGLGPWSRLERGREYRIVLNLGMERVDIPIWLKRSLFFWSWDVAPEAVYELEFTY